ncbi:MAG: type II toxin-antitoxin system RelE/ParE family toxin [Chloroflexota bacterium]
MRIARTERFKRAWKRLTKDEKNQARKALEKLVADMRYPSLGVKKIKGAEHVWEARASRSLRLTFQVDEDKIVLRNIGHHDETLGRP